MTEPLSDDRREEVRRIASEAKAAEAQWTNHCEYPESWNDLSADDVLALLAEAEGAGETGGTDDYLEAARLAVLATAEIERMMKAAKLTRTQLAKRVGVPKSRVTKVLDGESNMTLRTMARFALACGYRLDFVPTLVEKQKEKA